MRIKVLILILGLQSSAYLKAQDTFSILAFDSITGEVGAAGASCVDLFQYPGIPNDFITELFPGEGAIATQAAYLQLNQVNARNKFLEGDTPSQIINWLKTNDAGPFPDSSQNRQYGVLRLVNGSVQTAAHTGTACIDYKSHILGPNYTIHGNILLGQLVLDSMEARFNREKGDLACKLMAALQGANMVGADTRCAGNGSSSLFAFIKVSQPEDVFGQPSFLLSLKTHANDSIEPIDSLQILFDNARSCVVNTSGLIQQNTGAESFLIYPNPASYHLSIKTARNSSKTHCIIRDLLGEKIIETDFSSEINFTTTHWDRGVVFVELRARDNRIVVKKIILH